MQKINKTINKVANMPAPAKASIAFMFANFFQQGLQMVTTPIFTRLLTTDDYGAISVYNSWSAIISVVATLSLTAGVFNVGMMKYKSDRAGYISSMLTLSNVATLLVAIIFLIFSSVVGDVFLLPKSLMLLMFLNLFFSPATNFWLARQRYEYKYKLSSLLTIASASLSILISILAVISVNSKLAEVKLWSSSVIPLIFALIFYIVLMYRGKKYFNWEYWKFALMFNLPLLLHYLSFSILSGSDRVMIANMDSESAAGIYGLVYTASTMGNIIWNSINSSLIPYMHEKMEEKGFKEINNATVSVLGLYACFCAMVVLFAPEIIKILAPPQYHEGIFIFPPVMAGVFFIALYNVFGNIEFYYQKTFMIMVASVVAAITNVVLNYIFIPRYGYIAAAYTTLASYILLSVMHYFNLLRMQEEKIFNIKPIIFISLSLVVFCLGASTLYHNWMVRWGIIIIMIILGIVFKDRINSILLKLKNNT